MRTKYYNRGKAIITPRWHTYGRVIVEHNTLNRHQRRKDAKVKLLSLREIRGSQWSADRGRSKRKQIARRRAA